MLGLCVKLERLRPNSLMPKETARTPTPAGPRARAVMRPARKPKKLPAARPARFAALLKSTLGPAVSASALARAAWSAVKGSAIDPLQVVHDARPQEPLRALPGDGPPPGPLLRV